MSYHSGPTQDEYEETVREFERDMCKLEDRIVELEARAMRRAPVIELNPRSFQSRRDADLMQDEIDELRTIMTNQGRLLRALLHSVGELNDRIDDAPDAPTHEAA